MLDLNPDAIMARIGLSQSLLFRGDAVGALAESNRIGDPEAVHWTRALALYSQKSAEAKSAAMEFDQLFGKDSPYYSAEIHAYRAEPDLAIEALERAVTQRDGNVSYMNRDILLASLRGDPRFKALLRKVNLPE